MRNVTANLKYVDRIRGQVVGLSSMYFLNLTQLFSQVGNVSLHLELMGLVRVELKSGQELSPLSKNTYTERKEQIHIFPPF